MDVYHEVYYVPNLQLNIVLNGITRSHQEHCSLINPLTGYEKEKMSLK